MVKYYSLGANMKRAIFIFLVALLPLMLINIANENLVLMYETRDSRANIEPIDSLGKNSGIFSNTKSNNWAIQAVDDRGDYLSMAIDNNGNLHVSYCDFSNYDIKYAYFDGNQWHKNTVDSMNADEPALPHGRYVSIAVDNENRPHISYFDYENWTLKYAQYNGNQWHREYVDLAGNIGFDSSIAVDDNNNIHIAYKGGQTQGNLKYAHHNNTGWHIETVDRSERIGEWASIALNSSHNPHISYYDFPNGNLKHAYHNGSGWHNETVDWIGDVGDYSSMVIDDNDSIHISYSNNSAMKYAYYNGNRWRNETVDPHGYVGLYTSIALDPNNRPHISYYTSDRLKYTY